MAEKLWAIVGLRPSGAPVMSDDWFLDGLRLAAFLSMSGAFVAIGFAGVCKLLGWSPVNITINSIVYQRGEDR